MLSKRYESTKVDRRTWLHGPSGPQHTPINMYIQTNTRIKLFFTEQIQLQQVIHTNSENSLTLGTGLRFKTVYTS